MPANALSGVRTPMVLVLRLSSSRLSAIKQAHRQAEHMVVCNGSVYESPLDHTYRHGAPINGYRCSPAGQQTASGAACNYAFICG